MKERCFPGVFLFDKELLYLVAENAAHANASPLHDLHLKLMNLWTECHFQKQSTVNECSRAVLYFSGEPLHTLHLSCYCLFLARDQKRQSPEKKIYSPAYEGGGDDIMYHV